ncbi:hypothetical protein P3T73_03430 [Kiritimatiellota bacterium B12222]|nr:hypothetical protein P3T73_03430 [Kiritimatiellota bacterium B12222]
MTPQRKKLSEFTSQIIGSLTGKVCKYSMNQSIVIHGRLPVMGTLAEIWIDCSISWRQYPPSVYCFEPWIREDIDWHVYSWLEFCWVHDEEWKKYHEVFNPTPQTSSVYLMKNVEHLLQCHRLGYIHDIDTWQKEWGQYEHGDKAIPKLRRTYAEFRRRAKSVA